MTRRRLTPELEAAYDELALAAARVKRLEDMSSGSPVDHDSAEVYSPSPLPADPWEFRNSPNDAILKMGSIGDERTIGIRWFDHNNIRYHETIRVVIDEQDKPRKLSLYINDTLLRSIQAP